MTSKMGPRNALLTFWNLLLAQASVNTQVSGLRHAERGLLLHASTLTSFILADHLALGLLAGGYFGFGSKQSPKIKL